MPGSESRPDSIGAATSRPTTLATGFPFAGVTRRIRARSEAQVSLDYRKLAGFSSTRVVVFDMISRNHP